MSAVTLVLDGSVFSYWHIFLYGEFLNRTFKLDNSLPCPSVSQGDGVDYVPTQSPSLFGHHFTWIAGAGLIVGLVLVAEYAWLLVILWILLGSVFIGAMLPMFFMFVITIWALVLLLMQNFGKNRSLFVIGSIVLLLAINMLGFAQNKALRKKKKLTCKEEKDMLKKLTIALALLICGLGHAASILPVTLLEPGETFPNVVHCLPVGNVTQSSVSLQKVVESRQALDLNSGTDRAATSVYMDFGQELPEFTEAYINAQIHTTLNAMTEEVVVRLEDAEGEVFRFVAPLRNRFNGWQDIRIFIHGKKPMATLENVQAKGNGEIDMPCRLLSIGVDDIRNPSNSIGVGKVEFQVERAPVMPVFVCGWGTPFKVLKPGEEHNLGFVIDNQSGSDNRGTIYWTVTDDEGVVVSHHQEFVEMLAGSSRFFPLPRLERYGAYQVDLGYFNISEMRVLERNLSFVYLDVVAMQKSPRKITHLTTNRMVLGASLPGLGLGMEDLKNDAAMAEIAGLGMVRVLGHWRDFQQGIQQWSLDSVAGTCSVFNEKSIPTVLAISGCPEWAVDENIAPIYGVGAKSRRMPVYDYWTRLVGRVLDNYVGKICAIQIWNMPDSATGANFSKENYDRMLNGIYKVAKGNGISVVTGGFACPENSQNGDPQMALYVTKQGNYDVGAVSGVGDGEEIARQLNVLKTNMGGRPMIVSAAGSSSAVKGWRAQADDFFKKAVIAKANGASVMFWNAMRDSGKNGNAVRDNYGLLTNDGYPKSAFAACNTFARWFANAEFVEKEDWGHGCVGYTFRNGANQYLTVAWNESGIRGLSPLMVTGVSGTVEIYDSYGNKLLPEISRGTCTFDICDSPRFMVVSKQKTAPKVEGLVMAPVENFRVVAGRKDVVELEFLNPFSDQAVMYTLDIKLPEGVEPAGDMPTMCVVGGGQSRRVQVPVKSGANFASNYAQRKEIAISVTAGESWKNTMYYLLESVFPVPERNFDDEPNFLLCEREFNKLAGAAVKNIARSNGDFDFSGKVWLRTRDGNLQIKTVVTDDNHMVADKSGKLGDGCDNVVIAMQPAGVASPWIVRIGEGEKGPVLILENSPVKSITTARGARMTLTAESEGNETIYTLTVPLKTLGIAEGEKSGPMAFNLRINDSDGNGLEAYRCLSGGLDDRRLDVSRFLHISLQ